MGHELVLSIRTTVVEEFAVALPWLTRFHVTVTVP